VLTILFGLFTLLFPELSLEVFIWIFSAFIFIDGAYSIVTSFSKIKVEENWIMLLFQGAFGVVLSILIVSSPSLSAILLAVYIAFWMILVGAFEIIISIKVHKQIKGEGWYIASGIVSVLAGLLIIRKPEEGVLSFVWLIGLYALVSGSMILFTSFRLGRKLNRPH
jgi:uncharacterized membrane protein HdeD (DUF308 family)